MKEKEEKLKPKKRGPKPKINEDEEKVEVITIQYTIEHGRPNFNLNKSWATVVIDDLIGYEIDFEKKDVTLKINSS